MENEANIKARQREDGTYPGYGIGKTGSPAKNYLIYISGPMTGQEGFNYDAFNAVAKLLRDGGFQVLNPAENFGGSSDRDRTEYMREDFQHVLNASALLLLPNWTQSRGARIEVTMALELGLDFYVWPTCCDDTDDGLCLQQTDPGVIENVLFPANMTAQFPMAQQRQVSTSSSSSNENVIAPPKGKTILEEAMQITSEDRQKVYGHPINDFSKSIGAINALFKDKLLEPLDERDFTTIMICCKLARLQNTPDHRDSVLDIAGYARTREMVQEVMDAREGR